MKYIKYTNSLFNQCDIYKIFYDIPHDILQYHYFAQGSSCVSLHSESKILQRIGEHHI